MSWLEIKLEHTYSRKSSEDKSTSWYNKKPNNFKKDFNKFNCSKTEPYTIFSGFKHMLIINLLMIFFIKPAIWLTCQSSSSDSTAITTKLDTVLINY